MVYMIACTALMWNALFSMLGAFTRFFDGAKLRPVALLVPFVVVVPAILAASPVLALFLDAHALSTSGLESSDGRVSVWLSLAGGLLSLCVIVAQAVKTRSIGLSITGKVIWSAFASVMAFIVIIAAAKQITFVDDQTGFLNFDFFRESVTDVKCEGAVLLIKPAGNEIVYRCPTQFVFNKHSQAPFVPWPDYIEGKSPQLAKAVKDMMENANKFDSK